MSSPYREPATYKPPLVPAASKRSIQEEAQKQERNPSAAGAARQFDSGATRDTDEGKFQYYGFLSPLVLERFASYMHDNRIQSDGRLRASDNWKKGIPRGVYLDSLLRHVIEDLWQAHERHGIDFRDRSLASEEEVLDTLSAIIFNAQGLMFEILQGRDVGRYYQEEENETVGS